MNALLTPARIDVARSVANLLLAAAQPVAGQASRLSGSGEPIEDRSARTENAVTPAAGAFAIWGPIFASSLNYAVRTAARRDDPLVRRTGWLSAAAFAGNTVWELWAQYRGIGWRSVGIIAATAAAANAAMLTATRADAAEPNRALLLDTLAPLAGWLTVATAANLAGARQGDAKSVGGVTSNRGALALVAGAGVAASALTHAGRGELRYAGAAGWGLAGIALRNARDRNVPVFAAALAGLGLVGGAAIVARRG